jgi:hypothetical protein
VGSGPFVVLLGLDRRRAGGWRRSRGKMGGRCRPRAGTPSPSPPSRQHLRIVIDTARTASPRPSRSPPPRRRAAAAQAAAPARRYALRSPSRARYPYSQDTFISFLRCDWDTKARTIAPGGHSYHNQITTGQQPPAHWIGYPYTPPVDVSPLSRAGTSGTCVVAELAPARTDLCVRYPSVALSDTYDTFRS